MKEISEIIEISEKPSNKKQLSIKNLTKKERNEIVIKLTKEMKEAARMLEFEHAAFLRDQIEKISKEN